MSAGSLYSIPSESVEVIDDTDTTHQRSRGVLMGVNEQFDFYIRGAWVAFPAVPIGTILPIVASGARDSGDAAPTAGDCIFLF